MILLNEIGLLAQVFRHLCIQCAHRPKGMNDCPRVDLQDTPSITCLAFEPVPAKNAPVMSDDHIAAIPDREPCADCVSRVGTLANCQHHDLATFQQCLADRDPFLCVHGRDKGRICGGWLKAAKRYAEAEEIES